MATADIHVKIDAGIKKESDEILKKIGISISDLVNMTLRRVIYERRIPFDTQISDIELPESLSINSEEEFENLIHSRINHDTGKRYTTDEVETHLKARLKELEEKKLAYA